MINLFNFLYCLLNFKVKILKENSNLKFKVFSVTNIINLIILILSTN